VSTGRRLFPYLATFLALLVAGTIFVLRPTPFIGVTGSELAASLDGELGGAAVTDCEEVGEDAWRCTAATPAGDGELAFDVTTNGFGCWTAKPAGGEPRLATPATQTGCVTFFDH
jgi:hypothetical protein